MHDILFLHGFFELDPEASSLLRAIRAHLPHVTIHAPAYHPLGSVKQTSIKETLKLCHSIASSSATGRISLIGFSFGGLLASIISELYPHSIHKVLLFAPAIDNFERNYQGHPESSWIMPRIFVDELLTYPARPKITRPTILVHGSLDSDQGGCSLWRVQRWVNEQTFTAVHILDGVDHSLEPWLSEQKSRHQQQREHSQSGKAPTLGELLDELAA